MSTIHYSALRLRCATLRANGKRVKRLKKPFVLSVAARAAESKHRQTMATDHAESVLSIVILGQIISTSINWWLVIGSGLVVVGLMIFAILIFPDE